MRRTRRAPQIIRRVGGAAVVFLHDMLAREHAQVQRAPAPVHDCVLQREQFAQDKRGPS